MGSGGVSTIVATSLKFCQVPTRRSQQHSYCTLATHKGLQRPVAVHLRALWWRVFRRHEW